MRSRLRRGALPSLAAATLALAGCGGDGSTPPSQAAAAAGGPPPLFRDMTVASGIRFIHHNGLVRALHPNLLQTTGSGCAVFDYDADGLLDLYLIDGSHPEDGGNRLYRNLGGFRFEDVTDRAGLRGTGYGMGCAAGDYDNDGDPDLFLANYGVCRLYRNNGNGTFTDVTQHAGVALQGWSTVAAFIDVEGDGDLDLYVGRYVRFDEGSRQLCETAGVLGGCNPSEYEAEPDVLYINQGNGRFVDGTRAAGLTQRDGRALGVMVDDYNDDGRPDIFVANDGSACFLFRNRGGGRFEEVAVPAGVAYSVGGRALASMGCDWGDYTGDGLLDLIIGSFEGEMQGLYRALGGGLFLASAAEAGIGAATTRVLTFGCGFLDYDLDGDLDFAQANGHVHPLIETVDPEAPYRQPRQLFENTGDGRFRDVSLAAGREFVAPTVGRGMAFGDLDNDGDIDLLVSNNGLAAELFRNDQAFGRHWLGVILDHPDREARALGAVVTVTAGDRKVKRRMRTSYSYAGANDPRGHFGLDSHSGPVDVEVRWPGGRTTRATGVAVDQYVTLTPLGVRTVTLRPATAPQTGNPS